MRVNFYDVAFIFGLFIDVIELIIIDFRIEKIKLRLGDLRYLHLKFSFFDYLCPFFIVN